MDPIQYIVAQSRRRNLDPQAVLAVFGQEGLSGGIGDAGTSFGPGQLHIGGALPRAVGARGPRYAQRWAWSPQGINYALDRIAGVARGRRGRQAIQAIVSGFERPANPSREISGAIGSYGRAGRAGRPLGVSNALQQPRGRRLAASPGIGQPPAGVDVSGIVNLTNSLVGLPPVTLPIQRPSPVRPPARRQTHGGLRSAPPQPAVSAPRRGGKSIRFLEHFAAPYGLTVTSTTGGKHAKGSYHYKGRAVDFGGDPARMAALQRQALQHPQAFAEVFYTGPGAAPYFVKDGVVRPVSELNRDLALGHRNHVHIAR